MEHWAIVGIDLSKNAFQVCAADDNGRTRHECKLGRKQLRNLAAKTSPCLVAMEACGSAYHWARVFQQFGHRVRLISPQY
jgi:transposase